MTRVCKLIPEVAKKIFKIFFWTPDGAVSRVQSSFFDFKHVAKAAKNDFIGLNESLSGALTLKKDFM